ncbi:uncharacterized protein [Temnothorax nylanderi]|uniref:uncharacterized protein isoform X2 n=1 Tax=Temnothorax nylanderi TaxID=102681 RepID=UPI003A893CAC
MDNEDRPVMPTAGTRAAIQDGCNEGEEKDEVIEASPSRSVVSKLRQFLELKLKRKIPNKCIDFGSCSSPNKHTSMQMENINILKARNEDQLLTKKVQKNNFNLDDTENKPPKKKKKLLDKSNVLSKRKDKEQFNLRCKADRAKLKGWDCWECREKKNSKNGRINARDIGTNMSDQIHQKVFGIRSS